MNEALENRLLAFLRAHQVATLAVMDADGPHAAAVFYAGDDDFNLYVLTDPQTRHGRAMTTNAEVAGTIQRDRQEWQEIQGVQFHGRCRQLNDADRAQAWELYRQRFPFAWAALPVWRIELTWMRLLDNRQGFGHKEDWRRADHI